jgi:hypothetical protein
MKPIAFVPQEFNDIKLGYFQDGATPCSPDRPLGKLSFIAINSPGKVIFDPQADSLLSVVPICAVYSVASRRLLKYYKLSAKLLTVKDLKTNILYTGEVKEPYRGQSISMGIRRSDLEERLWAAQNYHDNEIDLAVAGNTVTEGYMNLNMMEYVDFPFVPGRYEVWMSFSGLESNRVTVEIIEDDTEATKYVEKQ